MAASKFFTYNTAMKHILNGNIKLYSHTIKGMLLRDSYSPSTASHSSLAQISAYQATATGSLVPTVTLTNINITGSGVEIVKIDADDMNFTQNGETIVSAKYLALYAQSASSGGIDNLLWGFVNLDAASASASLGNSTQVNISWNSLGIVKYKTNAT